MLSIASGNTSKAEAWNYVSHAVRSIFTHLQKSRSPGYRTKDPSNMIWGCLKGKAAADAMLLTTFHKHPVVATVLNMHLQQSTVMRDEFEQVAKGLKNDIARLTGLVVTGLVESAKIIADKALQKAGKGWRPQLVQTPVKEKKGEVWPQPGAPLSDLNVEHPSLGEPEVPQVAHEGLIAEKAQFTIKQLATKISILSDEEPNWSWYVGCSGRILWMASTNDIPARADTDPPWHPKSATVLGDLPPVEILLVQGRWPEDADQIWKLSELKVALQVVKKPTASRGTGKRKRSKPLTVSSMEGWECGSGEVRVEPVFS
jgi:hypothetical protein